MSRDDPTELLKLEQERSAQLETYAADLSRTYGELRRHLHHMTVLHEVSTRIVSALDPDEVPLNFLDPRPGTPFGELSPMSAPEALKAIATFRLALPRTILRFAGGREITLGDLGTRDGLLGGVNAVIVGNYLTTLGRAATDDLELLADLQMPIKTLSSTL